MRKFAGVKLFLTFIVVAIVLVGCTPNTGNNNNNNNNNTPITLQWWGVFWDKDVVDSLLADYKQVAPNVTIEYVNKWPGGARESAAKLYQDELNRVLGSGNAATMPDIFMVENTWVGEYSSHAAPASASVIDVNTLRSSYYPAVAVDFSDGQQVYGLPLWIDVLAILYNRDLLTQASTTTPPANWIDFRDLAQRLTKRSGATITQSGFAAGTADNVSFSSELLQILLLQNGVRLADDAGNPVFASSSNAEGAVSFYKQFAAGTSTWNSSLDQDAVMFLEGDLAMMAAPSWRLHDILHFNDLYDLKLNIGVSAMPQLPGQASNINWATYWGAMVSKNRPNSIASWQFLNWINQPAQLEKLRANESLKREFFGFLYPRSDMQSKLVGDTYLRVFNDALPTARTWYMTNGLEVRPAWKELIISSGTVNNLTAAQSRIQKIVDERGILPK
jgi:multiple sugar transport system substrate-binding protein